MQKNPIRANDLPMKDNCRYAILYLAGIGALLFRLGVAAVAGTEANRKRPLTIMTGAALYARVAALEIELGITVVVKVG